MKNVSREKTEIIKILIGKSACVLISCRIKPDFGAQTPK